MIYRTLILLGLLWGISPVWAQGMHAPGKHPARPQLATGATFSPDGRLWLSGLNAQGKLFVRSAPGSDLKQFGPEQLLDTTDVISADGENWPKLAFGPNGWAVLSYTQPLDKPYTGMIRMLRSSDGGKTFSAPFTVHQDRQEITHRFESIAFDPQGVLHTLWVDKRDGILAPKVNGKSTYRGAAIYRNESRDGGATFEPDTRLADYSCECCRIALIPGPDGVMRAMWRHVFEPSFRDHGFAVLKPGEQNKVVRATYDNWHLEACPHHGPGLALNGDKGYHTVWFGIRKENGEDVAAVRYALLKPDGSPELSSVRVLPDELAEHASVLSQGARVAIVWRSVEGTRSTLYAWLSTDSGTTFVKKVLGQTGGANDHPRTAQQGERMVVVWRNSKEAQVYELKF